MSRVKTFYHEEINSGNETEEEQSMSLIAKNTGTGEEFKKVPEGNHIARCVRVIDLGTQSYEWNGETHSSPKVMLSFEIPGERIEIEGKDLPMMLSIEYTKSLHEKANLRAALESWRGQKFTDEQLEGFDIRKLLDIPALITVMHGVSKKTGKTYATIVAIAPAKLGGKPMDCLSAENEILSYEIEEGLAGAFSKLPKYTQEKILKAPEISPVSVESAPDDISGLPF